MKIKFPLLQLLFPLCFVFLHQTVESQTLANYINQAKKNHISTTFNNSYLIDKNTTHLTFGYFINPQYTISGAQRAYAQLQQEIPWIGKSNSYRKLQKNVINQKELQKASEIEQLSFKVKECYYRMYQFQKQKDTYATWADELRAFIALNSNKTDSTSVDLALKQFEYQTQLIEITKKLQITDGYYQNQVIVFNNLLNSDNLEEPKLPLLLAMPDEESELEFPDPFESASYLSYENQLIQKQLINATQNPWKPTISLGIRYIDMSATKTITFGLPSKDIFEPQLQLKWNLFAKKNPRQTTIEADQLLDRKLSILGHQLQTAINNQISARITYDASTQKIEDLTKLENQLKSTQTEISKEKTLQINGLKYTFELSQIKAVADYYISTSKMLLFF